MAAAKFWLMKSEPESFSIDDLERVGQEPWDGVRNYQARNFMRDEMKVGDGVLFYHSNSKPSGIVGLGRVASEPYTDPSAFDRKSHYFDEKSDPENPRWILVDIGFVEKFSEVIPLADLKQDSKLETMLVIKKGQRLSIQPVERRHFSHILKLGGANTKISEFSRD